MMDCAISARRRGRRRVTRGRYTYDVMRVRTAFRHHQPFSSEVIIPFSAPLRYTWEGCSSNICYSVFVVVDLAFLPIRSIPTCRALLYHLEMFKCHVFPVDGKGRQLQGNLLVVTHSYVIRAIFSGVSSIPQSRFAARFLSMTNRTTQPSRRLASKTSRLKPSTAASVSSTRATPFFQVSSKP
jgi:hypothetical protein